MLKNSSITLLLVILVSLLIASCGKEESIRTVYVYSSLDDLTYEKSPITTHPRGTFNITLDPESECCGGVYVGVDPGAIPVGTYLYIKDIGFRVAAKDSRAQGRNIIYYGKVNLPKVKEAFIWQLSVKFDGKKEAPIVKEL